MKLFLLLSSKFVLPEEIVAFSTIKSFLKGFVFNMIFTGFVFADSEPSQIFIKVCEHILINIALVKLLPTINKNT